MKFNKENILKLIDEGYLIVNKHPEKELYIYNYSQKTQFERYWNEVTLMCRGLVLDADYNIIARPWNKFFNLEEHEQYEDAVDIPDLPFEVFEKMDGSLGILFWYDGEWIMCTRGSFISDQAIKGKEIFDDIFSYDKILDARSQYSLMETCTYLFEIIYPSNRIVVNYGKEEKLTLLSVIVTSTGEEIPYDKIVALHGEDFDIVKRYDDLNDFATLREVEDDEREGYVLKYSNGFRVKAKFQEYCRLHRILTNVSNKIIWRNLKDNESMDELLDKVPDEFYDWVRDTIRDLKAAYAEIELEALRKFKDIIFELSDTEFDKKFYTKKEFAMLANEYKDRGILYSMYDGKDYSGAIWKQIKPVYTKPFVDEDKEKGMID